MYCQSDTNFPKCTKKNLQNEKIHYRSRHSHCPMLNNVDKAVFIHLVSMRGYFTQMMMSRSRKSMLCDQYEGYFP